MVDDAGGVAFGGAGFGAVRERGGDAQRGGVEGGLRDEAVGEGDAEEAGEACG